MEVRLREGFKQDSVSRKKRLLQKYAIKKILAKISDKVFKSAVRL